MPTVNGLCAPSRRRRWSGWSCWVNAPCIMRSSSTWPTIIRSAIIKASPNHRITPEPARPEAEETALVRGRTDLAHYWAGLVFVAGFGLNIVRRLAPAEASPGWWLFSGQVEVLLACGAFAVISLWLYWSRIGSLLHQPEDRQRD